MAGTNKITRTIESVTETEISKASYLGWELSFNVNRTGGIIQSISLYGTKDGAQVNASRSQDGYTSVGFTNGVRDEALYKAILDEFEAIAGAGE